MSVFEAGMMVCFGISWPIAALKTYRCKCVHGKSIHFSMLILLGYICGIAHKVLDDMDWVFWLYILNTFFLLVDMYLYWLYRNNKAPAADEKNKLEINEEAVID
ncbi:MAG: hypothetical protein BHW55_05055 [Candidatus Melainabacteria bacterium 35_41]|nr:MAG: hypothetical protein BHW55_05055 [Candidatus Melainabacteria bacterium 35_41]